MNFTSAFAIFVGSGAGALFRWGLGSALNPVFGTVPLGTLAANLIGGLLMGVALALFSHFESLPPVVRFAVTAGFIGGLTTFSTFSAEASTLLLRKEYVWAAVLIGAHVVLSLVATMGGLGATRWLLAASASGASQ